MIAISLQVLVSMGGLAVNCNREGMVCLGCDQGTEEGNSTIVLVTLNIELYCWISAVNMIQEYLFIGLLLNDTSAIHIPEPISRGVGADCIASPSKYSIYKLATIGLTREPIAAPSTCL